jgi:hypothetical protein
MRSKTLSELQGGQPKKKKLLHVCRLLMFWSEYFCCEIVCFALDCPVFPDSGPYLRHFDQNNHEKYVDLILYR